MTRHGDTTPVAGGTRTRREGPLETVIIVNPAAGHGRAGRLIDRCRLAAHRHWPDPQVLMTESPGHAAELATTATRDGARRILVLGGDGTVHEAANGILAAGAGSTLGVVPVGTGNDFARLCGVNGLRPEQAIALLGSGSERRIDVGRAWDEFFVNSLGVGIDAAVAARADGMKRLSGMVAYVVAALAILPSYRPLRLTVSAGGIEIRKQILALEVGNGQTCGGGVRLTPDAVPDDGLLDVCIVEPMATLTAVRHLGDFVAGRHVGLPQVTMLKCDRLTITSEGRSLAAHFDGESRTGPNPLEITSAPRALSVMFAGNA